MFILHTENLITFFNQYYIFMAIHMKLSSAQYYQTWWQVFPHLPDFQVDFGSAAEKSWRRRKFAQWMNWTLTGH